MKTTYAPDVLARMRVNKLAKFVLNHRNKLRTAPASAPQAAAAGPSPSPSQPLPTIPEVQR
eukprot:10355234-Alexandrium_andersonii.AAC.1